jgi:hypothetical protein
MYLNNFVKLRKEISSIAHQSENGQWDCSDLASSSGSRPWFLGSYNLITWPGTKGEHCQTNMLQSMYLPAMALIAAPIIWLLHRRQTQLVRIFSPPLLYRVSLSANWKISTPSGCRSDAAASRLRSVYSRPLTVQSTSHVDITYNPSALSIRALNIVWARRVRD